MTPATALAPVVAGAFVLVALLGGSSPAAEHGQDPTTPDLLSSAHPTPARTTVRDTAYAAAEVRRTLVETDTAALTSSTCDGCVGESTTLHVLYAPAARRARLDNVANAWAQECRGCTGTALSVQVVVLDGHPVTAPSNRALALTAACEDCRTSALAFQVVLVGDPAAPMSAAELAALRAWVDGQAALLRASVSGPPPVPPTTPTPTTDPTPTPSLTPEPATSVPGSPSPTRPTTDTRPSAPHKAHARRDPASALGQLQGLLSSALDARVVAADVEVSR